MRVPAHCGHVPARRGDVPARLGHIPAQCSIVCQYAFRQRIKVYLRRERSNMTTVRRCLSFYMCGMRRCVNLRASIVTQRTAGHFVNISELVQLPQDLAIIVLLQGPVRICFSHKPLASVACCIVGAYARVFLAATIRERQCADGQCHYQNGIQWAAAQVPKFNILPECQHVITLPSATNR